MERVALVTGAGTGVGKATSIALLKEGMIVYLVGRRIEKLKETEEEAKTLKLRGIPKIYSFDISLEKDVINLFNIINNEHGRLDLLFNNAGTSNSPKTIDQILFEEWKKVVDVNLHGMFLCAKHAFSIMKNQDNMGGRIINNGSISAMAPRPGSVPYTTTKHAITGLTKAISLDGRKFKIACSQIDIGNAETPMTKKIKEGVIQANGELLAEPVMKSEDIANAIVYISKLPLSANVLNMTIMANNMPFVGRG